MSPFEDIATCLAFKKQLPLREQWSANQRMLHFYAPMVTQMRPIKKIPDKSTARGPGASISIPKPEPRKCCPSVLIGNQSTQKVF